MDTWLLLQHADASDEDADSADELADGLGSATVERTSTDEELAELLESLDGRVAVVCGGDGALHLVVNQLGRRDLLADSRVALFPLGTGNDFATTLDLPREPQEMADMLRAGHFRTTDVLRIDDRWSCVNALHTGVGVDAAQRASSLKASLGDLAYPIGSMAAAFDVEGWQVEVTVDGDTLRPPGGDELALMVVVANGRTIGGGHVVAPAADPSDGRLDVVMVCATAPRARVGFGLALTRGTHLDRDDVIHASGSRVEIRGEPVGYNVDGEVWDNEVADRDIELARAALHIASPG